MFSNLKLVRWGWLSGTIAIVVGAIILATFLAQFNYLTPSGPITVTGRVIEVTPNVTSQVIAIPIKTNVPVKTGDVLFQIDPAPYRYKVTQLQASLAAARQQTQILKANYEQATANVAAPGAQQRQASRRDTVPSYLRSTEAATNCPRCGHFGTNCILAPPHRDRPLRVDRSGATRLIS